MRVPELWHIADGRTGQRVSVTAFLNEAQANLQIQRWRDRDAKGKRQDIHHLMPHMVARIGL